MDHGGGARRRHGAVRQPRLPAADASCAASISRRRSRGCSIARRRSDPEQAETVGDGAACKFTDLSAAPPGVSGRVGGGRGRRDDDRRPTTRFSRRGRSPARKRSTPSRKLEALVGDAADDRAHAGEPADAAADAADPGVRHPGGLRPSRLGAGRVRHRGRHRRPRRADRALVGPEDEARRLARSDGRQAAARHHVHRADAARPGARRTGCRSG